MDNFRTSSGKQVPFWTSCRVHLAFIVAFGYLFVYLLRFNLSVAIVCMVRVSTPLSVADITNDGNSNSTSSSIDISENLTDIPEKWSLCVNLQSVTPENTTGEFDWKKPLKGAILSSFFYGYIVTQMAGGWLAGRFGGKHVYGVSMFISIICTLLTPVAARTNPIIVISLRVVMGLALGVSFPATHAMWGCWAPPFERAKLVSFSYAGTMLGTIVAMTFSGIMCSVTTDNGWPLIFYINGAAGVVWLVWWYYCAFSSPDIHPRISAEEKEYLLTSIGKSVYTDRASTPPWADILTSKAVWAIVIAHTCDNWGSYTILTSVPMYLKEVLRFDIKANGFLMALPYVVMYVMVVITGQLADLIKSKGLLTTTSIRKMCTLFATLIPASFITAMGFMDCQRRYSSVAMLVITVGFTAFCRSGYSVNHVDIAPKYAGLLFGLSNTMATIPGMVSPVVVGLLTPNGTQQEWQTVFFICAAVYVVGAISYVILGSGEEQPWAKAVLNPVDQGEAEMLKQFPMPAETKLK